MPLSLVSPLPRPPPPAPPPPLPPLRCCRVAELQPDTFFLGAGEVDLKVGFSARDFIAAYQVRSRTARVSLPPH